MEACSADKWRPLSLMAASTSQTTAFAAWPTPFQTFKMCVVNADAFGSFTLFFSQVYVNGCTQLSDKSVSYLLKTCPRLITISFRGTNLGFVSHQRSSNDPASIRANGSALISPHFASISEGNVLTRSAFFPSTKHQEVSNHLIVFEW